MTQRHGTSIPWRRASARTALTLVASISFMSCGSGAGQPATTGRASAGVGDAFAAQALEVCQTVIGSKDAWRAFPVQNFDPNHPDASAFPEVATWLEDEVGPTFDAWRDDLTTLGTPPTGTAAWTEVLDAVDTIARLNADQVAAARTGDVDAFVEATNGLHDVQPELERATAAAGVARCAQVHAA